jgi:hypothetical protein
VNKRVRLFSLQVGQPMTHRFASCGHCLEKPAILIYIILFKGDDSANAVIICV